MALPEGVELPEGMDEAEAMEAFEAYVAFKQQKEEPQEDVSSFTPYDKMTPENQAKFRAESANISKLGTEQAKLESDIAFSEGMDKTGDQMIDAGITGLSTIGGAAGAAKLGAGALLTGAAATAGEFGGRAVSKEAGFRDEINPEDLLSVNPLKNPAIGNFGIPLITKLWKSVRGGKALTPELQEGLDLANRKGQIPDGVDLGKLKSTGSIPAKQSQAVNKGLESTSKLTNLAGKSEDDLIKVIGAELGAQAGNTAVERAVADTFYKKASPLLKTGFFESVDSVDDMVRVAQDQADIAYKTKLKVAEKAGDNIVIKPKDISEGLSAFEDTIRKMRKSSETSAVADAIEARINKNLGDFATSRNSQILDKTGQPMSVPVKPKNLLDTVEILEDINWSRRELLKQFDSGNISKTVVGDSLAEQEAIKALDFVQSSLNKAIEKGVAQAVENGTLMAGEASRFLEANKLYGAYRSVEELGEKFSRGTLQGLATRDSTRLMQNPTSPRQPRQIPTTAGGAVQDIIQTIRKPQMAPTQNALELGQVLDRGQNAASNIKSINKLKGQNLAIPETKPPRYMEALATGKLARDAALFTDYPEILNSFVEYVDPQTFGIVSQAFAEGTEDEKKRGLSMLAQAAPDAFETSIPGINSVVNDTVYDETEKQYASQKLSEVFKSDTNKRLNAKAALVKNQPLPPYAIEALGGTVTREKLPEDVFLEEVEGGQQLQAYTLPSKGSGVTVGTGVDLGNRNAQELRELGIPEDLVIKLSPHLGKKDDRARQSIKNSPLQLTPDEADLLDNKIKGQIKGQIGGSYKEHTGVDIESLPEQARTVLYSLAYNFGADLKKKIPTGWDKIVKGDWEGLQKFLKNTKWKQPELKDRRLKEAALLESLIPRLPGDEPEFNPDQTMYAQLASDEEPIV